MTLISLCYVIFLYRFTYYLIITRAKVVQKIELCKYNLSFITIQSDFSLKRDTCAIVNSGNINALCDKGIDKDTIMQTANGGPCGAVLGYDIHK